MNKLETNLNNYLFLYSRRQEREIHMFLFINIILLVIFSIYIYVQQTQFNMKAQRKHRIKNEYNILLKLTDEQTTLLPNTFARTHTDTHTHFHYVYLKSFPSCLVLVLSFSCSVCFYFLIFFTLLVLSLFKNLIAKIGFCHHFSRFRRCVDCFCWNCCFWCCNNCWCRLLK